MCELRKRLVNPDNGRENEAYDCQERICVQGCFEELD